ncbi:MAG: Asp-tRNA(Asn)/Glu-tRNA(Gln) amidotransferase subunit GatA [Chitinophagales bacterium]
MQHYKNLKVIQQDIAAKKITCAELVEFYLSNIAQSQTTNAYLEVFEEEARQKAKELDQKIAHGEKIGRLHGMVIAIKDVICYKNHKVSASSNILPNFESLFSSTAVERILAEDAIIIGRTNCDEFAMGSTNENSAYGVVRNFADQNKVPGGSSGGSAVAVQANTCLAALGSDTGGSVRQPASFCNVIGFKPTYGRISRHGLIAYASSFDQIGTLTHSVEDAALLLEIMAGKDDFDGTNSSKPVPSYSQSLQQKPTAKKRIAYFKEALENKGLDAEIQQKIKDLLTQLQSEGHTVEAVSFPYLDYIVPTYYILTTAEASSNLSRFDGIHYGHRSKDAKNMEDTYRNSRSEGFGAEVQRRIMLGTFVLSSGYYDAYYSKAQKVRRLIHDYTRNIFKDFDFILTPTTPTPAFDIGDKEYQDPVSMYLADIYTVQANIVGIPAISLPLSHHSNGMSFGVQLMADKFEEEALLGFGKEVANYQNQ